MPETPLAHSAAAERNREPILACLRQLLGREGRALEVASGTGQHAAHFAAALPGWSWQPTDLASTHFGSIAAWAASAGARNVATPLRLDVLQSPWPAEGAPFATGFDLIYCANMLHIAPWPCCAGLMQGAARHLAPGGLLVTYGPYLEDGVPTAEGNRAFDARLRAQDAAWGIRRLEDVAATAANAGLALRERHALPANNLLLVWSRAAEQPQGSDCATPAPPPACRPPTEPIH